MRFEEMFRAATGYSPYPYQVRLAESDLLPPMIDVPTGAGKTAAVVLAWLWRRRYAPESVRHGTPRRLVYCLPMRSLVDQTRDAVVRWLDRLQLLDGSVSYADDGKSRVLSYSPSWSRESGISVTVLMGGEDADKWDGHPERDAVIIGTQDMLLSRALNRGYAMSRFRWPVHFGLLNNDVLWAVDEPQIMGVGVETTVQLQAFRSILGTHGSSASIWMSATLEQDRFVTVDSPKPEGGWHELSLSGDDLKDSGLMARYSAHKPVQRAPVALTSESAEGTYINDLAALAIKTHRQDSLTIIVMNNVKRAQGLYSALLGLGRHEGNTGLLHSRFREPDRARGMNILASEGDRMIVSTQVVEAGVDASSKTLISELAPWSSMVQRFGRCNRYGEFGDSNIYWVDIQAAGDGGFELPYDAKDLEATRAALSGMADASPQKLRMVHVATSPVARAVLRRKDLFDLFDTTPDLLGNDVDVSAFVRDGSDRDVKVYWRDLSGDAPSAGIPSPSRAELCGVPVDEMNRFLKRRPAWTWDHLESGWVAIGKNGEMSEARPGMILLADASAGGYSSSMGWTGLSGEVKKPAPVPVLAPVESAPDRSLEDDIESWSSEWVKLDMHLHDVAGEAMSIARGLGMTEPLSSDIVIAGRWHDVGKAHEAFQNMLVVGHPDEGKLGPDGLWAKSGPPRRSASYFVSKDGRSVARRYFRHELASALAWMSSSDESAANPDLVAFLIAAHHGKVRMSIRSVPSEEKPRDDVLFARGIWQGDSLPRVLPVLKSEVALDLSPMLLGEGSWTSRMLHLRDDGSLGPFRMSMAETVLRVADWRASSRKVGPP